MRKITVKDFMASSERVRKSLTSEGMAAYEKWNQAFGDIS
jgi:SpoVK/Ycf46/Vps4 family AAA+-type ATPase